MHHSALQLPLPRLRRHCLARPPQRRLQPRSQACLVHLPRLPQRQLLPQRVAPLGSALPVHLPRQHLPRPQRRLLAVSASVVRKHQCPASGCPRTLMTIEVASVNRRQHITSVLWPTARSSMSDQLMCTGGAAGSLFGAPAALAPQSDAAATASAAPAAPAAPAMQPASNQLFAFGNQLAPAASAAADGERKNLSILS